MKDTRNFTTEEMAVFTELAQLKNAVSYDRFRSCQAYISEYIRKNAETFTIIKSYNTIVAIVNHTEGIFIEFGKFSSTTSKQVTQIYNSHYRFYNRHFVNTKIDQW